ncbi:hypothetical protein MAR_003601 [Mya arenaria]|uniref:Uncharacterized protein n=1 Tax=Mya arenaria TaxID=6604 RepID=A0ABY7G6G8_MYAAR|nr:hypothetical protein MAR_003601 [Mya arenaria]
MQRLEAKKGTITNNLPEEEGDAGSSANVSQGHRRGFGSAENPEDENIPGIVVSRTNLKYSIEKNLLTDVALAMHSGISVQDILDDIASKKVDPRD